MRIPGPPFPRRRQSCPARGPLRLRLAPGSARGAARVAAWLALGLAAACGGDPPAEVETARYVVLAEVEQRDIEERIVATGELIAKHRAEVAAQVAGEITEVLADEGAAVSEGDIVMEIDPERRQLELNRTQARVSEARAGVREAQRELDRMLELARRDVASKSQKDNAETTLQTARSRLQAAEAELGVAERALRDASVRARFDGLIARRVVSRGEYVQAGQPLFELVSLSPLEIEFHLPEAESSRVRLGLELEVSVAPWPDETFPARVSMISPIIDARTRTLRVKALLDNSERRLRPGLFARADLGIARRAGVAMVPEEAVVQRADGPSAYRVLADERVERVPLELGVIRDGSVEISHGLAPGDRVVLRGHRGLIDGSLVSARNRDGSPTVAAGPDDVNGARP